MNIDLATRRMVSLISLVAADILIVEQSTGRPSARD